MVKNIVFDMGRVLLDYDADLVSRHFTDREDEIIKLNEELYQSEEWILLDRGVITEEEAMEEVKKRLPDSRLKDLADKCMRHWHEYNLSPKEGMEELIKSLKENGYGIYLCSNASHRLRVFQDQIPGIQYFDGILVSAEEKCIKPEPEIFTRLFEKFHICPEESFFIDDLSSNIDGARACGMDGYCFADGNVEKLRQALVEKGIRIGMASNRERSSS